MTHRDRLRAIFDVFSRRHKPIRTKDGRDAVSGRLRRRILLLYRDVISGRWQGTHPDGGVSVRNPYASFPADFWAEVHNSLEHLLARSPLQEEVTSWNQAWDPATDVWAFLNHCSASELLDFVELSFKQRSTFAVMEDGAGVVDALNEAFTQEKAAFRLTPIVWDEERSRVVAYPQIIRVEDDLVHAKIMEPALHRLSGRPYSTANAEFRDALADYRRGDYGDCLTKCNSAFESTLKVLCRQNGWSSNGAESVSKLLKVVVDRSGLPSLFYKPLELIGTMRNELSTAHGGGSRVRCVERHTAEYAINVTAAAVIFLIQQAGE